MRAHSVRRGGKRDPIGNQSRGLFPKGHIPDKFPDDQFYLGDVAYSLEAKSTSDALKDIFYRLPCLYDLVVCPRSFSKIAYRVVQMLYDFMVWAGRKHIVVPERIGIASGTVLTRGLAYFVANDLSTLAQFVVWPEASIIRPDAILPALVQFPGCQTSGGADGESLGISSSANRTPERDLLFGIEILGNSANRGGLVVTFVIGQAAHIIPLVFSKNLVSKASGHGPLILTFLLDTLIDLLVAPVRFLGVLISGTTEGGGGVVVFRLNAFLAHPIRLRQRILGDAFKEFRLGARGTKARIELLGVGYGGRSELYTESFGFRTPVEPARIADLDGRLDIDERRRRRRSGDRTGKRTWHST